MPTTLTIAGNTTEDPKAFGKNNVELRIASNEGKDKTVYWTAKFLNHRAVETILQYVKKGSSVFVSGRTEEETWEGKDGQKNRKMVCIGESFAFMSGGKKSEEEAPAKKKRAQQKDLPPVDDSDDSDDGMDGVPF